MICNNDFDYFREVIDYDCDYIAFSINVIDYDYEFVIVIVIVPTNAITDYDYPMPAPHTSLSHYNTKYQITRNSHFKYDIPDFVYLF